MNNRIAALSLSLALTASLSTTAFAVSSFTDVPDSHWAAPSITRMAEKGVVSGVGNNLYAPESTISNAEFITMIVRQFYADKVGAPGDKWYSAYMDAADTSILSRVFIYDKYYSGGSSILSAIDAPITRYNMAQLIFNVMVGKGMRMASLSDTSEIADWEAVPKPYCEAVSACYALGLLAGVNSAGTFNGSGSVNRAQAAVIIDRLLESQSTPQFTSKGSNVPASMAPEISQYMAAVADTKELFGGIFYNGYYSSGGGTSTRNNPHLRFHFGGAYKTITFTVLSQRTDLLVRAYKPGAHPMDNVIFLGERTTVVAGNCTQVTFDVTSLDEFVIRFGNDQGAYECYNFVITDIQLS